MTGPFAAGFDLATLRAAYRDGETDPVAVADAVLARIATHDDPALWICRVPDADLRAAAAALPARLAGSDVDSLPLYGVPFAVKDNIDVAGLPTTAACPDFAYMPADTAPAVQRLLDAGALLVGKTNLDQFATGLVGVRSPYGVCRNAIDSNYVPGGSSAGSATAVSAGLVGFSLGTDTAGSGRVPAGFNNIVGIKPTRGLVSTRGVVPACRTLDCVSVFALTAADGAAVLDVAAGHDPDDAYSRADSRPGTLPHLPDLAGVRLGVPAGKLLEFFGDAAYARAFARAVDAARALHATVTEIDFAPFAETAALLYDGPWVAERMVAMRDFLDRSPDSVHPVTRAIVETARNYAAADVYAAMYRLAALRRRSEAVWDDIGALLLPTAGSMYTRAEVEAEPVKLNSNLGYYTNFVNLLDLAAIAVPAAFAADGRPFGVTLVAPAFRDRWLAAAGGALHRAAGVALGATGASHPPSDVESATASVAVAPADSDMPIAVNGAHMRGLPLNGQLLELGARFVREDRTAPAYRLYALEDFAPIRPGMVRVGETGGQATDGASIALEIWALPSAAVGRFLAQIPPPLGLGTLELASGATVKGFLCEAAATAAARDITAHGGWRAWLAEKG